MDVNFHTPLSCRPAWGLLRAYPRKDRLIVIAKVIACLIVLTCLLSSAAFAMPKVEIFVTSWCPHCRALEAFLKEKKVSFNRYDIEKSPYGKRRHQELGGGGVPVMTIGKEVLKGFNREAVLEALERARKPQGGMQRTALTNDMGFIL